MEGFSILGIDRGGRVRGMSKSAKFRITRLYGDEILVEHPDWGEMAVMGQLRPPFFAISRGDQVVAVPLPDVGASMETEHDLSWIWDDYYAERWDELSDEEKALIEGLQR